MNSQLAVNGGVLYSLAYFTNGGGSATNAFARWDGVNWTVITAGSLVPNATNYTGFPLGVRATAVDSRGVLYAAGSFTNVGEAAAQYIAGWTGANWSALGSECEGTIYCLASDTRGNVYAGGAFLYAGNVEANGIARWDGTNWYAIGGGLTGWVEALTFDSAGTLYAGAVIYLESRANPQLF